MGLGKGTRFRGGAGGGRAQGRARGWATGGIE